MRLQGGKGNRFSESCVSIKSSARTDGVGKWGKDRGW